MFYNMGGKVKLLGKIQFWALSALSLCFAIAIVLTNMLPPKDVLEYIPSFFLQWPNGLCETVGDAFIRALIVFVCGTVIAYVSAVPVIAFGELVEDTAENKRISRSLSDHLRSKTSTTAPINNTAKQQAAYQQTYPVSPYQVYQPVAVAPVAPAAPVASPAAEPAPAAPVVEPVAVAAPEAAPAAEPVAEMPAMTEPVAVPATEEPTPTAE